MIEIHGGILIGADDGDMMDRVHSDLFISERLFMLMVTAPQFLF